MDKNHLTSFVLQGETFSIGETVFFNDNVLLEEKNNSYKIGGTTKGFCIGCEDFYAESMPPIVFEKFGELVGFGNKCSKTSGNIFAVSVRIKYGDPKTSSFRYRVMEFPYWFICSQQTYKNGRGKRLEKKLHL